MNEWIERQSDRKRNSDTEHDYFYRIDQSRVVNSVAFRRLQSKTQVHGVGESDFFRTRLTHSMEVAQIGKSITHRLNFIAGKKECESEKWIAPIPLIEAICLAHDLGHPAFGHNGERTLNYFLHRDGGFEGNGQTFRILTKLGEYSSDFGYNLTRRTLLGVVKYPVLHRQLDHVYPSPEQTTVIDISKWSPPKCIHDTENEALEWVLNPFSDRDKELFTSTTLVKGKLKSQFKSFDTSIMECADDIAYGIHDLEDALVMRLLHRDEVCEKLTHELEELSKLVTKRWNNTNKSYLAMKLASGKLEDTKAAISSIINELVRSTTITKQKMFESPLLDFQCTMSDEHLDILKSFQDFVYEQVISQPSVQTLEFKGQKIITDIFMALKSKPYMLLPSIVQEKVSDEISLERVVADYISSMTDIEACKLYQRLFTPEQGSVFAPLI
ncbi:anti-phage deoxyguanosine triphosphatase [Vibrio caribbeanicus]|uniref:Deoxyguanosinetriphosphate triphosphohydrolase-like protein n=1 Tax=Vibrio caribbeanicus ATCC BAA-2122 TaxID=796620 RepID=E3BHB1_9VIBR|nr:anti-phage deoxyguanosine triphosphatase [Vibrio caribbeanicus]EFP97559.1 deoxyguanosinetriphosphate triphosphohydrolase-like protein [Vibrio caribbeanicus ATCC BAA-2122]